MYRFEESPYDLGKIIYPLNCILFWKKSHAASALMHHCLLSPYACYIF
jgi:hypothetical protein